MLSKPIAVLGGGNGAQTMAADLTLAGFKVHLYQTPSFAHDPNFAPVLQTRKIRLEGIGRCGTAQISRVTTDIEEALEGVTWINVVVPASAHETFFQELIPSLRDGHIVVIWAGDYGSLRLAEMIRSRNINKRVLMAETNTLPYGTRIETPGTVRLLLSAPRVLISAVPGAETGKVIELLKPVYPCLVPCRNVIVAGLCNPNPIVHPPGSLLNVGRIEYSKGQFWMYREGITESVARVIRKVFEEAEAVAKAWGFEVEQYEDRDFRTTASIMGVAFQAPFDTIGVIASIAGPHSVRDRYITEDLPYGLVPLVQFGEKLSVPTPVVRSLVEIGCVVCNEDFFKTGRTLDKLGIAHLSPQEIAERVDKTGMF